jgi:hypothetical protein
MKITEIIQKKGGMVLVVIAIMLGLWILQKWLTAKTPVSEVELRQFQSMQIRRLPCGNYKKQVVDLEGPTGVKIVQILDPTGNILKEKRLPVDLEHCASIGNGVFVPDLWKDCNLEP